MMEVLSEMLTTYFAKILKVYELRAIYISDNVALLLGRHYALEFGANHDRLDDVYYLARNKRRLLVSYNLRGLIAQRLTSQDRAEYGDPSTAAEKLVASLRVCAACLLNQCGDILSGDGSWKEKEIAEQLNMTAASAKIFARELL